MSSKNSFVLSILKNPFSLYLLLLIQFITHILVYFNTNSFREISEAGALFGNLDLIRSGERLLPLYGFYWYFTPAYIAYFIELLMGSLHAYFIFHTLLSVLTTFIIYKIVS